MYLAIYRWKTSIFLWRNNRRLWLTIIPCGFLGSFFDKKQGKFCQNLVALFPFAAKIVGAQKKIHFIVHPQHQCQSILISIVVNKKHCGQKKTSIKTNFANTSIFGWFELWFRGGLSHWLNSTARLVSDLCQHLARISSLHPSAKFEVARGSGLEESVMFGMVQSSNFQYFQLLRFEYEHLAFFSSKLWSNCSEVFFEDFCWSSKVRFLSKKFKVQNFWVWPNTIRLHGSTGTANTIHPLREIMMKVILSNMGWSIVLPLVNA